MTKFLSVPLLFAFVSCSSGPGPVTPTTRVERQMIGLLQKFDRWDESGDGFLVASELKQAEKLSGHPPEKIIGFYDTNHDGKISLREAQKGYSRVEEAEIQARQ
ncbi:EF-hand domain-containing protein [Luteolibacter yonseiensis]|uniref:EF-hand domain-containing protein n=1 Tax=Luteolibacter yonseiensis TaxID=1144680 RepID=A0A934R352_9BACT|nr:EF-hand domain-containing protein [Luteolibacter yonseiensis]MBK1814435.1 EF-hand domain-containing protein [Luteolibacter yonseiensis]